jgi:ribosomal protein L12E/L44/L45/RPP1/RPP2
MKKPPSRVSIQYTVDFQEVPERVRLMLVELSNSYNAIGGKAREISNQIKTDLVDSVKSMNELSSLVDKSRIRIDDCTAILLGYVKILQEIIQEKEALEKAQAAAAPSEPKKKPKKTSKKKKATKKKEDE